MHQLQGGEREMLWFFSLFEILFMFGIIGFIVLYVFRVVKLFSRSTSDNNPNANQNARRTGNVGDRYSTINSHYSNATLSGSIGNINIKKTSNNGDPNHQHAYEHKVTPVDEASVINMHEERKEAYMEKKRQRKEELPKSSYSETQNVVLASNGGAYRDVNREYGKNGDNGTMPMRNEEAVRCPYCNAVNIVPASRRKTYSCYFCRQEV